MRPRQSAEWLMRGILVIALATGCMSACRSVAPADVAGEWVIRRQSRADYLSRAQQRAAGKLILNTNGTFTASELPEELLYMPPEAGDGLVTGSGVWRVSSREGSALVDLRFDTITAGQRGSVPYGTSVYISSSPWSSRIELYYFHGDPDAYRRIVFERR